MSEQFGVFGTTAGKPARCYGWTSQVLFLWVRVLHFSLTDNGAGNVECVATVDHSDIRGLATA